MEQGSHHEIRVRRGDGRRNQLSDLDQMIDVGLGAGAFAPLLGMPFGGEPRGVKNLLHGLHKMLGSVYDGRTPGRTVANR